MRRVGLAGATALAATMLAHPAAAQSVPVRCEAGTCRVRLTPDQLEAAGFTWKGYMEDMGADPARESATCGHVAVGAVDHTGRATPQDQYAAKHNPFVYFHSIIDDPARCDKHVVNLDALNRDLTDVATTPNFAFISPNLCHDGHDADRPAPHRRSGIRQRQNLGGLRARSGAVPHHAPPQSHRAAHRAPLPGTI